MSPSPLLRPIPIQQDPTPTSSNRTENDSPLRSSSSSPRQLVRRVVERTSDKLGRSKSVGSKSQYSPKLQRPSLPGSPKRFLSQSQKSRQAASTGHLGGTYNACTLHIKSFQARPMNIVETTAPAQLADNGSASASPSSESSPTKHLMSIESPFIRPSSPTQPRSQSSAPTFHGDSSAGVLHRDS
jgi:hypothetical protein